MLQIIDLQDWRKAKMKTSKKSLYYFLNTQLHEMCDNLKNNFDSIVEGRKNNPFLVVDQNISNYMGLGRSVDSQLGNRLQSIIFYLARLKYGDKHIPNSVVLFVDRENKIIEVKSFYVKLSDYEKAIKNDNGVFKQNAYRQYLYIATLGDNAIENTIIKDLKLKDEAGKYLNSIVIGTFENVNKKSLEYVIKHKKKKTEIDLLIFEKNKIQTFEIKLSGGLDTKNAPANIREVEELKKLFLFSKHNYSYFATCYSNGSGALSQSFSSESRILSFEDKLLKNHEFWDVVLPSNMSYSEFIDKYKTAFEQSGINVLIKELSKK